MNKNKLFTNKKHYIRKCLQVYISTQVYILKEIVFGAVFARLGWIKKSNEKNR